jgi:lysophospholipase L1-like esterase
MIENFTHLQTIRFHTLDDSVQRLFKSGNLNPGLLKYYINFPDRDIIFNNPAHPATKYSIQAMSKDLKEMKDICHRYNSNLVFVNLANNRFTGHIVVRTPSDVLNSYFTANNNIDPIYRSIANANEMPYMELTKHFIGLQNKSDYFFRYDGHPNEKGYEEIAKYIGKQLIEQDILKKEYK